MSEGNASTVTLHLNGNADLFSFLSAVKQCRQDVLFKTAEGDVLNLKSTLSQYLFAAISDKASLLENSTICCAKEDAEKLEASGMISPDTKRATVR